MNARLANLPLFVVAILGLLVASILGSHLATDTRGGVAAAFKVIGTMLTLICLVNPKLGLRILLVVMLYVDIFKRLGVYYGNANYMIVIETLAIPFIMLGAVIAGTAIRCILGREYTLSKFEFQCVIACLVVGGALAVVEFGRGGLRGMQGAANIGAYTFLAPALVILLKSEKEYVSLLRFSLIAAVPVALYGMYQKFVRFPDFEMFYASTGWSIGTYEALIDVPRAFGTLNSPHALSYLCATCAVIAFWFAMRYPKQRLLYFAMIGIFIGGSLASLMRMGMVSGMIMLVGYIMFQERWRVVLAYTGGIMMFFLLVFFARWIDSNWKVIQEFLYLFSFGGAYTDRLLTFGTYTARLQGFMALSDPSTYSWFGGGIGRQVGGHDFFTKILKTIGVIPMLALLTIAGYIAYRFHRYALGAPNRYRKTLINISIAGFLAVAGGSILGGSTMSIPPINYYIWLWIGGVLITMRQTDEEKALARQMKQDEERQKGKNSLRGSTTVPPVPQPSHIGVGGGYVYGKMS